MTASRQSFFFPFTCKITTIRKACHMIILMSLTRRLVPHKETCPTRGDRLPHRTQMGSTGPPILPLQLQTRRNPLPCNRARCQTTPCESDCPPSSRKPEPQRDPYPLAAGSMRASEFKHYHACWFCHMATPILSIPRGRYTTIPLRGCTTHAELPAKSLCHVVNHTHIHIIIIKTQLTTQP